MDEQIKPNSSDYDTKDAQKITWIEVARVYLKIGTIGFGGGYAVMDLIHSEIVEKRRWMAEQRYENTISLAEMAPGALTVNLLAAIAYRLGGVKTMILATIALILPSFLIIVLLSGLFLSWEGSNIVRGAMAGLTAGVVGLMLAVVWDLVKKFPHRWYYYASAACALLASLLLKVNPIWLVLLGGASGALKVLIQKMGVKKF